MILLEVLYSVMDKVIWWDFHNRFLVLSYELSFQSFQNSSEISLSKSFQFYSHCQVERNRAVLNLYAFLKVHRTKTFDLDFNFKKNLYLIRD